MSIPTPDNELPADKAGTGAEKAKSSGNTDDARKLIQFQDLVTSALIAAKIGSSLNAQDLSDLTGIDQHEVLAELQNNYDIENRAGEVSLSDFFDYAARKCGVDLLDERTITTIEKARYDVHQGVGGLGFPVNHSVSIFDEDDSEDKPSDSLIPLIRGPESDWDSGVISRMSEGDSDVRLEGDSGVSLGDSDVSLQEGSGVGLEGDSDVHLNLGEKDSGVNLADSDIFSDEELTDALGPLTTEEMEQVKKSDVRPLKWHEQEEFTGSDSGIGIDGSHENSSVSLEEGSGVNFGLDDDSDKTETGGGEVVVPARENEQFYDDVDCAIRESRDGFIDIHGMAFVLQLPLGREVEILYREHVIPNEDSDCIQLIIFIIYLAHTHGIDIRNDKVIQNEVAERAKKLGRELLPQNHDADYDPYNEGDADDEPYDEEDEETPKKSKAKEWIKEKLKSAGSGVSGILKKASEHKVKTGAAITGLAYMSYIGNFMPFLTLGPAAAAAALHFAKKRASGGKERKKLETAMNVTKVTAGVGALATLGLVGVGIPGLVAAAPNIAVAAGVPMWNQVKKIRWGKTMKWLGFGEKHDETADELDDKLENAKERYEKSKKKYDVLAGQEAMALKDRTTLSREFLEKLDNAERTMDADLEAVKQAREHKSEHAKPKHKTVLQQTGLAIGKSIKVAGPLTVGVGIPTAIATGYFTGASFGVSVFTGAAAGLFSAFKWGSKAAEKLFPEHTTHHPKPKAGAKTPKATPPSPPPAPHGHP